MSRNRTIDARRRGRRRQLTGVGLAVGAAAAVVGGAAPAGAGTTPITTTVTCTLVSINGGPAEPNHQLRTTGLVPNRYYQTLISTESERQTFFLDGFAFASDGEGTIVPPPFSDPPPVRFWWVVYDDTNGNGSWNHDVDQTYYNGEGTITDCPQTVTLSPK